MASTGSHVARRFLSLLCSIALVASSVVISPPSALAEGDPHFKVDSERDDVWGHGWAPDTELTVTVGDPGAPDFETSTWTDGSGNFFFMPLPYDVSPGHLMTVTDGTTTKEHTLLDVAIVGVDHETDMVWGTADPGADVQVIPDQTDVWRWTTANPTTGVWSVDFSVSAGPGSQDQAFDIEPGRRGSAVRYDADSDQSYVRWRVLDRRFTVRPESDDVYGSGWPGNTDLSITVGDPGDPAFETVVHTTVDGDFSVFFAGWDIAPDDTLTVSDGITSKAHHVTRLTVDGLDVDADTISGTAEPFSTVWVAMEPDGSNAMTTSVDAAGDWTADYSGMFDLRPGHAGIAQQLDEDFDATRVDWRIADPFFRVNPNTDDVWGGDWQPSASIDIIIGDPADPAHTESLTIDEAGDFGTRLSFDVTSDTTVTVTDGATTKDTFTTSLTVAGVDHDEDTVWGTAAPGSVVQVNAGDGDWVARWATADPSTGEWSVDFTDPAGGEWHERGFDIAPGSNGQAVQYDDDMDGTEVPWHVSNPAFKADPHGDNVWGWDWERNATVDIYIGDPGDPVFHTTSSTDDWGNFGIGPEYDFSVGDAVTVSDGTNVKETVVVALTVDGIDPEAETVWGSADPGSEVQVDVTNTGVWRLVTADPSTGEWTADFSVSSGGEPHDQAWDIQKGTDGEASR